MHKKFVILFIVLMVICFLATNSYALWGFGRPGIYFREDPNATKQYAAEIVMEGTISAGVLTVFQDASPDLTITSDQTSDADYARQCRINFEGLQSGGEESRLGTIEFAHDGTGDDQKGICTISVNDGNDDYVPSDVVTIDSNGYVGIGTASPARDLHILNSGASFMRIDRDGSIYWDIGVDSGSGHLDFKYSGTDFVTINYSTNAVGFGTNGPDKGLEINAATGGTLRLTYNDSDGSATDYCDFAVGADGGLTVTTVDSDGAAGNITFSLDGGLIYSVTAPQTIDATSDTIIANSINVLLNPSGNITLESTPTIANGTTGQLLYITCSNSEGDTTTFQDEDQLASTNLELGAATRAISGKDVLVLYFDGTDWVEVSYANN
jgi:hypothetical protein